jgi:hypothetical protein
MSEHEAPAESSATPPQPAVEASAPVAKSGVPWIASGLVLALCVVVAGVAASPLWAPPLAPLLPWSKPPAQYRALAEQLAALAGHIDALEAARRSEQQAATAERQGLAKRLSAVEARSGATGTAQLDDEIARLGERVAALEKRPSVSADDLAKMQQEVARLGKVTADLATRLPVVEKQVQELTAAGRGAAARLLALLQIREAVDGARPFGREYQVLAALAKGDPELASATTPLAKAAESGVASRADLAERLRELAPRIAAAAEPPPSADWRSATLARLKGLVKIRRIDRTAPEGAEAAVDAARRAMARGDLAGAVAALDKLSGAEAAAARPWLEAARARLEVENALAAVERIILTGLEGARPAAHKGASETRTPPSGPS